MSTVVSGTLLGYEGVNNTTLISGDWRMGYYIQSLLVHHSILKVRTTRYCSWGRAVTVICCKPLLPEGDRPFTSLCHWKGRNNLTRVSSRSSLITEGNVEYHSFGETYSQWRHVFSLTLNCKEKEDSPSLITSGLPRSLEGWNESSLFLVRGEQSFLSRSLIELMWVT